MTSQPPSFATAPSAREGAVRRAKKLLAIAQDHRANPAEAAAAASMAEKLMRKFQLDNSELIRAELSSGANFCSAVVHVRMKEKSAAAPKVVPAWAQWMAVQAAKLHDCQVRQCTTPEGRGVRFYGYAADVQICAASFGLLVAETIRSVRAFQKEALRTKTESDSYRRGFTLEVAELLRRENSAKAEEQTAAPASNQLVALKLAAVEAHFGAVEYKNKRTTATVNAAAFSRGQRDGGGVAVGRKAIASRSFP